MRCGLFMGHLLTQATAENKRERAGRFKEMLLCGISSEWGLGGSRDEGGGRRISQSFSHYNMNRVSANTSERGVKGEGWCLTPSPLNCACELPKYNILLEENHESI